jgi:hypothetical protein
VLTNDQLINQYREADARAHREFLNGLHGDPTAEPEPPVIQPPCTRAGKELAKRIGDARRVTTRHGHTFLRSFDGMWVSAARNHRPMFMDELARLYGNTIITSESAA